jgi:tetratricopeptide (TPR) repeat protein
MRRSCAASTWNIFFHLAHEAAPHLTGLEQKKWLAALQAEHDDVRGALDWSVVSGEAEAAQRTVGALWRFWQIRGHLKEGRERAERALGIARAKDFPAARERALEAAGGLAYWQGDFEAARGFYSEGVDLARQIGDKARIANALYNLAFGLFDKGQENPRAGALKLYEEALALGREAGDRAAVARYLWGLAGAHHELGRYDEALAELAEATGIFRELGDKFGLTWALHSSGLAWLRKNDAVAARKAFEEQMGLLSDTRDVPGVALALGNLFKVSLLEGDRPRAVRLRAAAEALAATVGSTLADYVDTIEKAAFQRETADDLAWAEGAAMSFDDAVAYALRR